MGALVGHGVRLGELKDKLAARTLNGKARPGYRRNVQKIRAEIARLEKEHGHGET